MVIIENTLNIDYIWIVEIDTTNEKCYPWFLCELSILLINAK